MTSAFSKYRRRLWYTRWNYVIVTSLYTILSAAIILALATFVVFLVVDTFILEDDLRQRHSPPPTSQESYHVARP